MDVKMIGLIAIIGLLFIDPAEPEYDAICIMVITYMVLLNIKL